LLQILKEFFWSLKDPVARMSMAYACVRNMPGSYGFSARARVLRRHFASIGERVRIHEGARFRNVHKISLGEYVTFGVDNFIQAAGGLTIGDYSLLGPGVKIWTTNHVFADPDVLIREQGAEYRAVTIGRDVWVGSNAFIMPGTELGDGCIVSAGSVVGAKSYPPYSILMGNPARVIGKRSKAAGTDDE
jgi:acetyltransferase-like isoleucine patch superfamily enzyme